MIKQLKNLEAVSLIKEVPTEGHSPLLILASDFQAYYIKNTKGQHPAIALINEFICYYFLQVWEINTPEIGVINMDKNLLNDELSQHHIAYFYNDITFGSCHIEGTQEMNYFSKINTKPRFNKLKKPDDFLKIALFDIWIENTDRKPTNPNLLFDITQKKIDIIAIDHAFTFDSQSYEHLYSKGISQTYNENILEHPFVKEITKRLKYEDRANAYFQF